MSKKSEYLKCYYKENIEKYKKSYKNFRKKNPEKCKEYSKSYCERNPEKIILLAAKTRAKQKNLEFNLELKDIYIPEYCPVFGIKLENRKDFEGHIDTSPSLDRIDNTKGYIKGNVKIISSKANRIKNDGTREEHQKVVEYLDRCQKQNLLPKLCKVS